MKWLGVLVLWLCAGVVVVTAHAEQTTYSFPKKYHMNDQVWRLDYQGQSAHSIMAEYVLNRETVHNWTQLFTYQQLRHRQPRSLTPRDMATHIEVGLRKKNIKYQFELLSSSPKEAMVEFKVTAPLASQQDEIQRIIKTRGNHFVIIHYAIRKRNMGAKARKQWIANLKTVPIILI